MALFSQIWQHLEKISFNFKPKHYNILIQICTENFIPINYSQFLTTMKCEPDNETYKCLLENACEKGDVQQAFSVLSIMKDENITIDEEIFNLLVLGHTIHGYVKIIFAFIRPGSKANKLTKNGKNVLPKIL